MTTGWPVDNLPTEISSLVGRGAETLDVKNLLTASRLVTLTGVGGVGKTRLALHVAHRVRRVFADGVRLVELANVADPELMELTVMEAVGLHSVDADATRALVEYLRPKQLLLVLDNCEHLVDASAHFVDRMLRECPKVRVLATSREPLRILGEQIYPVPALSVPDESDELVGNPRFESMELFAARASAAVPTFAVTDSNKKAVAALCRRLDGLPLAIELAAVRLRALSVEEMLRKLDDRARLLDLGSRAAPARHQTLQAAIDWSFGLCSRQERTLWARLSVFAGGTTLAAAEEVCAGGSLAGEDVIEALTGLVDKSIVISEDVGGNRRFRLLELIRQYGSDRLRDWGEHARLRRRHQEYHLGLAQRFERTCFGPDQATLLADMRAENANLRVALRSCLNEPGLARDGLRLAGALWPYWLWCGLQREGRHWLDRVLAHDEEPSRDRANALWANGYLTALVGDPDYALTLLADARELAVKFGDPATLARVTSISGLAAMAGNDRVRGFRFLEKGIEQERVLGERYPYFALALLQLGYASCVVRDVDRAIPLLRESKAICESHGERWMLGWNLVDLGLAAWQQGRHQSAIRSLREGLRHKWALNDILGVAISVEFLAWCATSTGNAERAARLFGACGKLWGRLGAFLLGFEALVGWHDDCVRQVRQTLGEHRYQAAFDEGSGFSVARTVRFALGDQDTSPTTSSAPDERAVLTRRELQIAELITQGLSNKQIADTLVISSRTAEAHVEHILTKLGFTSRTRIAAWLTEQGRT
jgi:predicted ATPase/DNA-binding CsgD family transcriptional regulator